MARNISDYDSVTQGSNMNLQEMKALILNVTKEAILNKQHDECKRYGTFMTKFSRSHLEGIFWGLFVVVVLLLCTASYSHAKSEQLYLYDACHPNDAIELKKKHRRRRLDAVITTTICFLLAALCVALEGLSGTVLNYCQQHKVINFYWAMWGLTQVGSLIAILGVTIHQWTSLTEHKAPPWNIALGTPILVITAAAFLVGSWIRKKCKGFAGKDDEEVEHANPPAGIVQGVAPDGSFIVQFHGGEWRQIPGFQPVSKDKHGGATGRLSCTWSSVHSQRPVSEATLRDTDTSVPATPSGIASSEAGHAVIDLGHVE